MRPCPGGQHGRRDRDRNPAKQVASARQTSYVLPATREGALEGTAMGELPCFIWALLVRRRAAFWLLLLSVAQGASVWAQVEATPAAMIQRHGIPSGTPTPPPPPPTPTPIPCDCDGNHVVSIAELIQAVRLLLSGDSADACGGLDGNRDDVLTVDELVVGVRHALYGCMALAMPDAVFDANVFFPDRDPFAPAIVRQD